VTRTAAPGWLLFVSSDLPRASVTRIILVAGIAAAALALLVASLVFVWLARARRNHALVLLLEGERDAAVLTVREVGAAALRLRSAAGTLRERAAALEAEAAGGKAAGAEASGLLGRAEESAGEVRSAIAARVSLLEGLAASARDAAGKSREALTAAETAGQSAAAAEEELNRVIATGSSVAASVESAGKTADTVAEAVERTRLLALNAALEALRSGGQGARIADEMRKLAEEAAARVQELSGMLADARSGARTVSRAAQDAGKAVHRAASHSSDSTRGLDAAWQDVNGMLTRLDAANASAGRLRGEADLSDRGRSAVEGASRIMARIETLCAEIAALAAAMAAESAQAAQRSTGPGFS
jgi:methyl-accepting chemotaxis protein